MIFRKLWPNKNINKNNSLNRPLFLRNRIGRTFSTTVHDAFVIIGNRQDFFGRAKFSGYNPRQINNDDRERSLFVPIAAYEGFDAPGVNAAQLSYAAVLQ